ncbi:MAG: hypothetical protein PVG90_10665 [Bacillota bacterium]|jgi:hypothetical protein
MKRQIGLRLTILILIGAMLLLSGHTHPHHFFCCGEDDHCPLCQILNTGFTVTTFFKLVLLLLTIGFITPSPLLAIKLSRPASCAGRSPPVNLPFLSKL